MTYVAYIGRSGPPPDPNALDPATVMLLLHFEGADGDTAVEDSSPFARTLTGHNAAKISATHSKWGGSSLRVSRIFENAGLQIGPTTDFNIPAAGTKWWFEFWIRYESAVTDNLALLFHWEGNDAHFVSFLSSTASSARHVIYGNNPSPGNEETFPYPGTLTTSAWHHIAIGYDGTTVRRFLDGVLKFSWPYSQPPDSSSRRVGVAGFYGSSNTTADGTTEIYMDELLFLRGVCLHTADFTPPTSPWSVA